MAVRVWSRTDRSECSSVRPRPAWKSSRFWRVWASSTMNPPVEYMFSGDRRGGDALWVRDRYSMTAPAARTASGRWSQPKDSRLMVP